ncbi:MAG TPA: hypothetical protein VND96_16960 [Candidatus Micrarchaeaceae archaeon]|nr:hypothetical protein [Candidatus Micrarchaeaceae archaeon]
MTFGTAATQLLERRVHPNVVQEMLGHSTITLTLDPYSHVMPGLHAQAANRCRSSSGRPPRAYANCGGFEYEIGVVGRDRIELSQLSRRSYDSGPGFVFEMVRADRERGGLKTVAMGFTRPLTLRLSPEANQHNCRAGYIWGRASLLVDEAKPQELRTWLSAH